MYKEERGIGATDVRDRVVGAWVVGAGVEGGGVAGWVFWEPSLLGAGVVGERVVRARVI